MQEWLKSDGLVDCSL